MVTINIIYPHYFILLLLNTVKNHLVSWTWQTKYWYWLFYILNITIFYQSTRSSVGYNWFKWYACQWDDTYENKWRYVYYSKLQKWMQYHWWTLRYQKIDASVANNSTEVNIIRDTVISTESTYHELCKSPSNQMLNSMKTSFFPRNINSFRHKHAFMCN